MLSDPLRLAARAWIPVLVLALAYVAWCDHLRIQHVKFVSSVAAEEAKPDPSSPSGYADGKRWLIVPEHNNPTYQWIEETQGMLARGDVRVRRVDYENSPFGRDVHAASPYRWWLALLAGLDHLGSDRPLGLAVEHAALFADPLLQILVLVAATVFAARRFGGLAACLVCLGLVGLYPLASAFLPGVANDFGMIQICSGASVLFVAAGALAPRGRSAWFVAGGCAGGCGLWLSAEAETPIIAGIGLGAVLWALVAGRAPSDEGDSALPPWRAWGFAGAIAGLLAYLIEYFPSHLEPQLRVNYPLYGLAWIGLGELLGRLTVWTSRRTPLGVKGAAACLLAAAAVASLPVALAMTGANAFIAGDLLSTRLTNLPNGVVEARLSDWFGHVGLSPEIAAVLLPLAALGAAVWIAASKATPGPVKGAVALAAGPVIVTALLATHQLRLWSTVDCMELVLLGTAAAGGPGRRAWLAAACAAPAIAFGIIQAAPVPDPPKAEDFKFTTSEVEALYERALAQWIADHAGPEGATVLTPPLRTSSFCFYGGLRGIGTQNWENREGLSATFRIINSTRPEEGQALIAQRAITHIIVPSWDNDFDEFARMGLKQPKDSFIYALHQTDGAVFPWLRALPYSLPSIPGFKDPSVLVLEVTDESDPATLRSRLVEYLIEMHHLDQAAYASRALLRYPADLGALVALAQVAKAGGDDEAFSKVLGAIVSNLSSSADRPMSWDRRVSLAVVLALGGRNDLAEAQVRLCAGDATDARIRELTTGSLYHLVVLCRHYGVSLGDARTQALTARLLPPELRERL